MKHIGIYTLVKLLALASLIQKNYEAKQFVEKQQYSVKIPQEQFAGNTSSELAQVQSKGKGIVSENESLQSAVIQGEGREVSWLR